MKSSDRDVNSCLEVGFAHVLDGRTLVVNSMDDGGIAIRIDGDGDGYRFLLDSVSTRRLAKFLSLVAECDSLLDPPAV